MKNPPVPQQGITLLVSTVAFLLAMPWVGRSKHLATVHSLQVIGQPSLIGGDITF